MMRVAQVMFSILLVGPFFVFSWMSTSMFPIPKIIFAEVASLIVLGLAAMLFVGQAPQVRLPATLSGAAVLCFLLVAAWSLATLGTATFPEVARKQIAVLAGMGGLCLAMRYLLRDPVWKQRHTVLVVLAASVTAIYAIIQFYGLDPIFCEKVFGQNYSCVSSRPGGKIVAGGFLGNPNFVGMTLAPGFFLSLGVFSRLYGKRQVWGSVLAALAALGLIFGIRASESATAMIALVVGLAAGVAQIVPLLLRRRRLLRGLMLAQAAGVAALIGVTLWMSLATLPHALIARWDDQLSGRLFAWRIAGRMASRRLVTGVGLGGYQPAFFQFRSDLLREPEAGAYRVARLQKYRWEAAHNEYLQLFAELGLPGLLFLVGLLLAVAGAAAQRLRLSRQPDVVEAAGRVFEFQAWMALMLMAAAHYPFHFPTLAVLVVFTTALVTTPSAARSPAMNHAASARPVRVIVSLPTRVWLRVGLQAGIGVAAGLLILLPLHAFRADAALERGGRIFKAYRNQLRTKGDDLGATNTTLLLLSRKRLKVARDLNPSRSRTWYLLGNTYLLTRDVDKAMLAYLHALQREYSDSFHYAVAVAAQSRGYLARARREYVRLLAFEPNNQKYASLLSRLLAVRNQEL